MIFSLDLNTDSESLPMTDAGSEFQTDGAAHRKERTVG